jgi:cobalamin transport system substrate-binding protein
MNSFQLPALSFQPFPKVRWVSPRNGEVTRWTLNSSWKLEAGRWKLALLCVLLLLLPLRPDVRTALAQANSKPSRIISVIPAVTEMLFAIGAGPQIVAVGSFDRYPPEVQKLERVGALLDPNLERILALKPDLVVVYNSQTDFIQQLERAGIPMFRYQHAGLADITVTIRQLGAAIGRRQEADGVAGRIEGQLAAIRKRVEGRTRPRTLVVFDREALALRGAFASGGIGFISDMLDVAGGTNVFADVQRQSVQATSELILARRPEVVLELRPEQLAPDLLAREQAVWKALPGVPAVKNGRVLFITDQRVVVPGPRVAEGTELIARALHPEAFK